RQCALRAQGGCRIAALAPAGPQLCALLARGFSCDLPRAASGLEKEAPMCYLRAGSGPPGETPMPRAIWAGWLWACSPLLPRPRAWTCSSPVRPCSRRAVARGSAVALAARVVLAATAVVAQAQSNRQALYRTHPRAEDWAALRNSCCPWDRRCECESD